MEERTAVPQRPQKSPGFAGVLGIFPFGVGALYNGQYTKALLYLVIFAGLTSMQGHGGQPFVGLLLTGFIVFQFFDNIQSARAVNAVSLGEVPAGSIAQPLPEIASSGSIFWGIVLIVLGVLLIMANFEVISYDALFDFWPIAVIVVGLRLVLDSVARTKKSQ